MDPEFMDDFMDSDYMEDAIEEHTDDPEDTDSDGLDDFIESIDDDVTNSIAEEFDDDYGGPIILAGTAGFGHHMAEDELEERKIAERLLKKKDKLKVKKVPLLSRNDEAKQKRKGHVSPFGRWSTKANIDPNTAKEKIEYSKKEQREIIRGECY
jgi:hypothetical protein